MNSDYVSTRDMCELVAMLRKQSGGFCNINLSTYGCLSFLFADRREFFMPTASTKEETLRRFKYNVEVCGNSDFVLERRMVLFVPVFEKWAARQGGDFNE